MPPRPNRATRTRSNAEVAFDWFKSVDADPSACDDWDIKPDLLQDAVLGLLSLGRGITFGRAWDGEQIVITVYDGEVKKRKYISDSIEFDDTLAQICQRVKQVKSKENEEKRAANGG